MILPTGRYQPVKLLPLCNGEHSGHLLTQTLRRSLRAPTFVVLSTNNDNEKHWKNNGSVAFVKDRA